MTTTKPNHRFWNGRSVFMTGHTGFKGSWLSIWLQQMGASLTGYSLAPPTHPSLFDWAAVAEEMENHIADIRDYEALLGAMTASRPEVVFHLAAQTLVGESYRQPRETYETNLMGTVNVLEATRHCESVRSVVIVTTDKCYENREWYWGYRENDALGGYDPYSSSKATAELAAAAYRNSFFNPEEYGRTHTVALATARAGNVIGYGDWAKDRLLPDVVRAYESGEVLEIRHPEAIRPWQHALEPLSGYLLLGESLHQGLRHSGAWNFGPHQTETMSVREVVETAHRLLPELRVHYGSESTHHETYLLKLDISRAQALLDWHPLWSTEEAIRRTLAPWQSAGRGEHASRSVCEQDILDYMNAVPETGS